MKVILIAISLLFVTVSNSNAQAYSAWITDSNHPTLKVRYATIKDKDNYSYISLEIQSSVGCKFNATASYCNKDVNSRNGWQNVLLVKNKPVIKTFKILNSCTNGFWWWYKDYKSTAVNF